MKLNGRTRANFRAKHSGNGHLAERVRGEIAIRTMTSARSYPKLPAGLNMKSQTIRDRLYHDHRFPPEEISYAKTQ